MYKKTEHQLTFVDDFFYHSVGNEIKKIAGSVLLK
ncbi:hypothetical protein BF29_2657 [Heyndrickxia coagulans DSM 1 = ATCC 7050]|nr:hypothetical protein BF29_2657 [Heyndrickxia coagulans DSM 1 = ATCC 7050]